MSSNIGCFVFTWNYICLLSLVDFKGSLKFCILNGGFLHYVARYDGDVLSVPA